MKSLEHLALVRRHFHAEFKTLFVFKVIIKITMTVINEMT